MQRKRWRSMTTASISQFLRRVCAMPANRHLTGKELAKKYFTDITRGGLIVHCWRHGIPLPRTRRWPRERRTIGTRRR